MKPITLTIVAPLYLIVSDRIQLLLMLLHLSFKCCEKRYMEKYCIWYCALKSPNEFEVFFYDVVTEKRKHRDCYITSVVCGTKAADES